jgi:hypothetical protein
MTNDISITTTLTLLNGDDNNPTYVNKFAAINPIIINVNTNPLLVFVLLDTNSDIEPPVELIDEDEDVGLSLNNPPRTGGGASCCPALMMGGILLLVLYFYLCMYLEESSICY